MGWKPVKITFSSDYFDTLHEYAIRLIKSGKAYVCHQTKEEIEKSREIIRNNFANPDAPPGNPNSPWRDSSVEENLQKFDDMRKGKYAANAATLRLKMDMTSPNPNMWDSVAYRIKYMPHPHAGDKWCIYPTYDYTHCLVDSIEHIDYSICTLEFETRRESYFWLLEALDLYRPKVYEMSRLNITYTMLSKRKLLKLVMNGFMEGWSDPRMPTLKGLRRRGYSPAILNSFCRDIGVTRNFNHVQYERLAQHARSILHESSPRVMAVLNPLKIHLTWPAGCETAVTSSSVIKVPDFPFDVERGDHEVPMESSIFIDASDFRMEDSLDYFGLAPGKVVNLKYAFRIRCTDVETGSDGAPIALRCDVVSDSSTASEDKAKTSIQWVPASSAVPVEVRMYNHLFVVEEPTDAGWEAELNQDSRIVVHTALVDPSIKKHNTSPEVHFQFERIGFFVVDNDNLEPKRGAAAELAAAGCGGHGKLVFNLTVNLKDSKPKSEAANGSSGAVDANKSRKEAQDKALAEKEARKNLSPVDMFKSETSLYSAFDTDGLPTHDAEGKEISKNALKKLRKDWEKQKRLYESNK